MPAGTLPRKAPEFTVQLTNGRQVPISQFKGKTVALIFILTYCPHCQKTIGSPSKEQAEYGARGFQALASANIRAQYAGDDPFLNEDRQETNIRQKIDQLLTEGKK